MIRSVGIQQWECKLCVLCSLSPTYLLTYLSLQRPNGVTFLASPGSTEFTKRWNPQSGDIVSYKHHGFLLGTKKPKFPTLYRVRDDLQWHDVVQNWKEVKYQKPRGTLTTLLQYFNGLTSSCLPPQQQCLREAKLSPKDFGTRWKIDASSSFASQRICSLIPCNLPAGIVQAYCRSSLLTRYFSWDRQRINIALPLLQLYIGCGKFACCLW